MDIPLQILYVLDFKSDGIIIFSSVLMYWIVASISLLQHASDSNAGRNGVILALVKNEQAKKLYYIKPDTNMTEGDYSPLKSSDNYIYTTSFNNKWCWGSAVSIVYHYRLDDRGSIPGKGRRIYL
jgi:hypothetical protein